MTIKRTTEHTTRWQPGGKPCGVMHPVVCTLELSDSFNVRLGYEASIDRRYSRH